MPPKRAKTAAAQTTSTTTRATRATRSRPAKEPVEAAHKEDDDGTSLVKDATGRARRRRGAEVEEEEIVVAGGLGEGDVAGAHKKSKAAPGAEMDAEAEKGGGAEDAAQEVQEEAVVAKPQRGRRTRPAPKKIARSAEDQKAMEALKRRMEAEKKGTHDVSEPLEEDNEVVPESQPTKSAAHSRRITRSPSAPLRTVPGSAIRPASAVKMQSTPGGEHSVLALANFQRRKRQPSILQMVQQQESFDDTTDLTLQTEDDFAPYDESTPLQVSKQQQPADEAQQEPAVEDDDELYRLSVSPPRSSRKRKSGEMEGESEIQVIRSSPSSPLSSPAPSLPENPGDAVPATAPEGPDPDEDENGNESDTIQVQHSQPFSDTYAEPLSSSPPRPTPRSTQRSKPQPKPTRTGRNTSTKAKGLDTATLRALLPRRRVQAASTARGAGARRSSFDIPTSSDADVDVDSTNLSDENDASFQGRRPKSKKRPTNLNPKQAQQAKKKGTLSPVAKKTVPKPKPKPRLSRTYGRVSSDKENAVVVSSDQESELDEPEDSLSPAVAAKKSVGAKARSAELERAREKFAVIDEWEMEFESNSLAGGSSPWR